jgi:ATP-dependent Lhr-like helicase
VRGTPIALVTRKHWPLWQAAAPQPAMELPLSHAAEAMRAYLRAHGASFFDEIASGTGLLTAQAEDGLNELVAAGLVGADSYGGLRALLLPLARKRRLAARGRRLALHGLAEAGRWSLARGTAAAAAPDVEHIALTLLRRYGVVFRRLLTREPEWLPPWYQLLRVYRRLEAQGHIRGGRFVAGITGEQYALPEAVAALRAARARAPEERLVSLSAADPLNLTGILAPGVRVPALVGNRILLRDGIPVALHVGGHTELLAVLEPAAEWAARNALLRRQMPRPAGSGSRPALM